MTTLILPIVLSTIALFFASFLAWMVVPLHRKDWVKLEREDDLITTVRDLGASPGNYMFPGCETPAEMKSVPSVAVPPVGAPDSAKSTVTTWELGAESVTLIPSETRCT